MRMFKITIDGKSHHEPARGRTAEELQHALTYPPLDEGESYVYRNVRVSEWISGGARGTEPSDDND